MWEGKLEQTQVKVNNIVERRLQRNCGCRRISCTRIFNDDLIQSTIRNSRFGSCSRSTTTRNNYRRCLRITRTRISNSNTIQDAGRCQLTVQWECNFRTQCVVMGIIITKVVVLKFLNFTNFSAFCEYRSTCTKRRNDNLKICTRTSKARSKNTINTSNIDRCCSISLTRRGYNSSSNLSRNSSSFSILGIFNSNVD